MALVFKGFEQNLPEVLKGTLLLNSVRERFSYSTRNIWRYETAGKPVTATYEMSLETGELEKLNVLHKVGEKPTSCAS